MRRIFLLILFVITIGCAGSQIHPIMSSYEKLDSFNIGQTQEKTIGEPMVYVLDAWSVPGFIAIADYQIPGVLMVKYPLIKPGYTCEVIGTLENGDYICSLNDRPLVSGSSVNWYYCLIINKLGEPYGDTACSPIYVREWSEGPKNIFKPQKFFKEGSRQQELIYNGRSKDMMKMQYREYKNDLARPAFYQDLIYDLSESKEIGFRGMIIEIIEATNSYVKFIVKSKMN